MLFWFTESLFSPLIADTNLTIWRGGGKKYKTKPTKPNPRRREKHWWVLSGIQAIRPHPFPLSHFLWCSGIEDHLKVLLWDPNDTRPSCLLSPGLSGALALAHTHTQPHPYRPTRSWRTGCIRVVSAATLVPAFGRLLKFSGGLWVGLVVTALSIFLNFFFFHFSVSMRSKQVMSLEPPVSSSAILQGLLSEVRGPRAPGLT